MKVYTVIVEYSNDYDTGGFDFIGTKRSLDDAKTLAAEWYKQYVEQGVERARKQYLTFCKAMLQYIYAKGVTYGTNIDYNMSEIRASICRVYQALPAASI